MRLNRLHQQLDLPRITWQADYYGADSEERVYIKLRTSCGYTNAIKKPSRKDSKPIATVEIKNHLTKKWG